LNCSIVWDRSFGVVWSKSFDVAFFVWIAMKQCLTKQMQGKEEEPELTERKSTREEKRLWEA